MNHPEQTFIILLGLALGAVCIKGPTGGPAPADAQAEKPMPQTTSQPAGRLHRPRTSEREQERFRMVSRQLSPRGITDPAVINAMRHVPRHWFVPARQGSSAYEDHPLFIGEGQTISQPYIVAFMTQALRLNATSKVLEVGTGSGYQAAVLAEITPHVYTIEILEPLGRRAAEAFKRHGYDTIKTRIGDGYAGWPEAAPFDAIIVTCAPDHIPAKLIDQLKAGGRLCIPVGTRRSVQKLILAVKQPDGSIRKTNLLPVAFVPMTGEAESKLDR